MVQGRKGRLDRAALKFVGLFFLFVLILTLMIQIPWVDHSLVGPYTELLASIGGGFLKLLGSHALVVGTVIRQGSFAVDIRRGCDGIVASILLVSACLAYPFSWKNRFWGTLFGYALIFVLNMVRIVVLFLIGATGSSRTFTFFHIYVSQFAVIAITMVFWIYWASRRPAAVNR